MSGLWRAGCGAHTFQDHTCHNVMNMGFNVMRTSLRLCLSASMALSAFVGMTACQSLSPRQRPRFEFAEPQMGVPFRLVFYARDASQAQSAQAAAFLEIQRLNLVFSDYQDDSELSRLNRTAGTGQYIKVSPDMWRVLKFSQQLSVKSKGAFDITIAPVVGMWRTARRQQQLPDEGRLERAKSLVGFRNLRLRESDHSVCLTLPNMRLDLGAIAKGYAVDAALAKLKQHGIDRAMVAGADLCASREPPGTSGWRVELSTLDGTNSTPARFVLLKNQALATSGDSFQFLEVGGKRYSHIVDPHTGLGLTDHSLVNVIGPNCTTADSLATAISVLGPDKGLDVLRSYPGFLGRIVRKPGTATEVMESHGFARWLEDHPAAHGRTAKP